MCWSHIFQVWAAATYALALKTITSCTQELTETFLGTKSSCAEQKKLTNVQIIGFARTCLILLHSWSHVLSTHKICENNFVINYYNCMAIHGREELLL